MKSDAAVLSFRDAVPADIDAIMALVESAYRGDASRAGWTTEADLLDGQRIDVQGLRDTLANPAARIVLALSDDELVACCELQRQGELGYFGMFSVRPHGQGHGVGKCVLAEAERIARDEWRCSGMQMSVIDIRAELIAWYERRGYSRTGVYKPFPYGDERFGIPKRDDLRFEILHKPLS